MVTGGTSGAPIRYADSGGDRIAYQQYGRGPHLLGVPPAAQNIEMAWEWPDIAAMLDRFGRFSTYTHFDKRGTGSSDRTSRVPGLDERVQDLVAVMDDAGIDRAHILGISEGGPMAILFAHAFPDRVDSLILYGTGASIVPQDLSPEELAEVRAGLGHFCQVWGTPESITVDMFAPSQAGNAAFRRWFEVYERRSATPDTLGELLRLWEVDVVSDLLPQLEVPVLIQHRTGDRIVPVAQGRALAAAIPGVELIEYEGDDHFGFVGDVEAWMGDLERWVTGTVVERPVIRPGTPRIVTLGRFAVERPDVDGRLEEVPVAEWGSRLARQVCKRLAAARGWPVTREELVDQLWPDEADRQRLNARLSVHLSGVRKVLGGAIVADRDTVRLDLDRVRCDLDELHRSEGDEGVVAAYAGEFLPEDRHEDWAAPVRAEARARFAASARRLAEAATRSGSPEGAVDLARRLVAADRFDDGANRLLVTSLLAAGDDGEARRAHEAWAVAMAELDAPVPAFDQLA